MNTLKEEQVTSLSELLKNAKRAEQTIEQNPSSKENAIDRAVKRLNTLFEKYWTPLFDEDKEYPLWNEGLSIYFGQAKVITSCLNKLLLTRLYLLIAVRTTGLLILSQLLNLITKFFI